MPLPTENEKYKYTGRGLQNSKAGNYDFDLLVGHDECNKLRHSPSPIVLSSPTHHSPGAQNTIADAESRQMTDRTDWEVNPVIFQQINRLCGPLEIDLFAMRLTSQCPLYSWRPDPSSMAIDAFLQSWKGLKTYANPPWNLIGRILAQVQSQQSDVILVAHVWKTQPWFPMLLGILTDYPTQMPPRVEITSNLHPSPN